MPRPSGHKYAPGFPHRAVRALLLAQGKTWVSFARELRCDEKTVRGIVDGLRPGRRGKSLAVRERIEALLTDAAGGQPAVPAVRGRAQKRLVIALAERSWGEAELSKAIGRTVAEIRAAIGTNNRQLRREIQAALGVPIWGNVASRARADAASAPIQAPAHVQKKSPHATSR